MSKDKTRARDARLALIARAASPCGLTTGIEGFSWKLRPEPGSQKTTVGSTPDNRTPRD